MVVKSQYLWILKELLWNVFRCYSGLRPEELNEITKTYTWFPVRCDNRVTISIYEHNNLSETELC